MALTRVALATTPVLIRPLDASDSIDGLTDLLHRAYAELANMGLRFTATHQDAAITRRRIAGGECFVARLESRTVGTILLHHPGSGSTKVQWYQKPEVATVGQFGVDPEFQRGGIGLRLMSHAKRRARELGAKELALDTADQATHLIALYQRWGFRLVDEVQWDHTNYHSVVMSRTISRRTDK